MPVFREPTAPCWLWARLKHESTGIQRFVILYGPLVAGRTLEQRQKIHAVIHPAGAVIRRVIHNPDNFIVAAGLRTRGAKAAADGTVTLGKEAFHELLVHYGHGRSGRRVVGPMERPITTLVPTESKLFRADFHDRSARVRIGLALNL